MRKVFIWFFVLFLCGRVGAQDVRIDKASSISFFSEAPLENITALSESGSSALDIKTNDIAFKVAIKSFVFRKKLMQEHFNENYLESDQFPYATFAGKINGNIDWSRDGHYQITTQGNLDIHGVKKLYTTPATIDIKGGTITAHAKFQVKLADHQVKIPRVVIKNIAEVVEVEVSSTYQKQ